MLLITTKYYPDSCRSFSHLRDTVGSGFNHKRVAVDFVFVSVLSFSIEQYRVLKDHVVLSDVPYSMLFFFADKNDITDIFSC